jgi:hypothetical protein
MYSFTFFVITTVAWDSGFDDWGAMMSRFRVFSGLCVYLALLGVFELSGMGKVGDSCLLVRNRFDRIRSWEAAGNCVVTNVKEERWLMSGFYLSPFPLTSTLALSA